jgi:hypothetical protein
MHLAPQAWREHRGLAHLHYLLTNWLPEGAAHDRRGWEWFYLNALPYQNLRIITEGGDSGWPRTGSTATRPCTVAWHVASKRLAEGTADGLIRVWDVEREQTPLILRGPAPAYRFWGLRLLVWSPDGDRLAAGGKDGTVHAWETDSGRELPVFRGHKSSVMSVAYSSDGLRLAAAGQGQGEPPLDDAAKAKLRRQALDWLKAELTAWGRVLESGSPQAPPKKVRKPSDWKQDGDLAGIRDAAALARLPANEQEAFAQFWADVDAWDATLMLLQSGAPPLLRTAALQAWFGQDRELAATCDRALRVVRDTKDPTTAERVAKICSLRQADDRTHEAALVLARRAVELGKGHKYFVYFQMGLGLAEYRSRHYTAADAALLAASKLGKNIYSVSVTTAFYRAMSLFRQGQEDEARKLAAEAAAKMKPLPADEKNPLDGASSADDLILWMAYKEAKALIKFDTAPPPKAENDKQ